jgi:hypothetical protein
VGPTPAPRRTVGTVALRPDKSSVSVDYLT